MFWCIHFFQFQRKKSQKKSKRSTRKGKYSKNRFQEELESSEDEYDDYRVDKEDVESVDTKTVVENGTGESVETSEDNELSTSGVDGESGTYHHFIFVNVRLDRHREQRGNS